MIKHKKAQWGSVLETILLILGAVLLIIAVWGIYGKLNHKTAEEVCRASVLAQANTKVVGSFSGLTSPFSIKCEKRFVDIAPKSALEGSDPVALKPLEIHYNGRTIKRYDSLNDDIVNQIIANEMKVCFYQFGEGMLNAFDQHFFGNSDVCFVCAEVKFKDITTQQTFSGFIDYINNTYVPDKKYTYYEYFDQRGLSVIDWGRSITRFQKNYYPNDKIEFDSQATYAVVFAKQGRKLASWIGASADPYLQSIKMSASLWRSITDGNNDYHVYVVDANKLNDVCDIEAK
jgi:hypothetical protein